jgi:hypothetical protein
MIFSVYGEFYEDGISSCWASNPQVAVQVEKLINVFAGEHSRRDSKQN